MQAMIRGAHELEKEMIKSSMGIRKQQKVLKVKKIFLNIQNSRPNFI